MIRGIIIVLLASIKVSFCQSEKTTVLINDPKSYNLIGELGSPLGTTVSIEGIIQNGPSKGYEDGPTILILTINDSSIQNIIEIPVTPYFGSFGNKTLPEIETGHTYSFRVYETGKFVGIPSAAYREANIGIQASGFYFQNSLVVISGKEIKEKVVSPENFIGRTALISGVAINLNGTAYLKGRRWKLKLVDIPLWDTTEIGKNAEFLGLIESSDLSNVYLGSNGEASLYELENLENNYVKLRGMARSMNGEWWFHYRGTDLFVEKMQQLPNWSAEMHFQTMEISGKLVSIRAECVDPMDVDSHVYFHGEYIIVNPEYKIIDELLIPEILIED